MSPWSEESLKNRAVDGGRNIPMLMRLVIAMPVEKNCWKNLTSELSMPRKLMQLNGNFATLQRPAAFFWCSMQPFVQLGQKTVKAWDAFDPQAHWRAMSESLCGRKQRHDASRDVTERRRAQIWSCVSPINWQSRQSTSWRRHSTDFALPTQPS